MAHYPIFHYRQQLGPYKYSFFSGWTSKTRQKCSALGQFALLVHHTLLSFLPSFVVESSPTYPLFINIRVISGYRIIHHPICLFGCLVGWVSRARCELLFTNHIRPWRRLIVDLDRDDVFGCEIHFVKDFITSFLPIFFTASTLLPVGGWHYTPFLILFAFCLQLIRSALFSVAFCKFCERICALAPPTGQEPPESISRGLLSRLSNLICRF